MKVVCVGTDPAALYLGILLKRQDRSHNVRFIEGGGDTTPLPSSIVCNPLKRRLKLADDEVVAAANAEVATFDRVEVDTGDRAFETRGLAYASRPYGGPGRYPPAHRNGGRLRVCSLRAGCDRRGDRRRGPDRRRRSSRGPPLPTLPPAEATPGANLFLAFESTTERHALGYSFRATPGGMMHAVAWPHAGGSTVVVEAPAAVIRANGLEHASRPMQFSHSAASISRTRSTAYRLPATARGSRSSPSATAAGTPARPSSSAAPPTPRIFRSGSMSARAWRTPRRSPSCSTRMPRSKTP